MKKNKNQLSICVVGAGQWGINHIKTLSTLDCLGGVIDKSESALEKIVNKYQDCFVSNSLEESFSYDFDGYIVSTKPSTHFQISKKIIENKKPLLVEKPLTLNVKDAINLNNLAKKNSVDLMVGHLLLFHPAFKKIKELINKGLLGEIQYIYSNRLNLGRFRSDENVLWSFAPHDISLFNYFFGDKPYEVSSNGLDILQDGIHDTSITSFKYSKKRMGHIFVSWLHPFKEHRFVIIGSNGMISFEDSDINKPLIFHDKKIEFINSIPTPKTGKSYNIDYDNNLPLTEELKYFLSVIDGEELKIANGDSAVDVMEVLDLATRSLMSD